MTDIKLPDSLLLKGCVASRPDVWDEHGMPRPGQPGAKVEFVREEVERAMQVVWETGGHASALEYTIELEDRAATAEALAAQRLQEKNTQVAEAEARSTELVRRLSEQHLEFEQRNAADRRRMQAQMDTIIDSREAAIREREEMKSKLDDAEALMRRMERDMLKARGARPSSSGQGMPPGFEDMLKGLFGQQQSSSGGSNPFEKLFESGGLFDQIQRDINRWFDDGEDGKGRGKR